MQIKEQDNISDAQYIIIIIIIICNHNEVIFTAMETHKTKIHTEMQFWNAP